MWWSHPKDKFLFGGLIQKKVHMQWSHSLIQKKVHMWWSHLKNKYVSGLATYVRLLLGSVCVSSDFQYFH